MSRLPYMPASVQIIEKVLLLLGFLLVSVSNYYIFMVVPNERIMGPVQRIFYFHVGSAIACYASFGIVFLCSIGYLTSRKRIFHIVNSAAGEVGFILCSITLISGMIWGKSAWNVWFNWEPRLVTFLLLWVIFGTFNLFRKFGHQKFLPSHLAILGIIGALTVPLVWLSVKFLNQAIQLHPQVIERGGLKSVSYRICFVLSTISLIVFQLYLVVFRSRVILTEEIVQRYLSKKVDSK